MLSATTRLALAAVATAMLVGGLGAIAVGGALAASGLWLVIVGAVVLVAVAVERNRYRSEAAETSFESAGPGGGEPSANLDPRFRQTPETFVDPTTGASMRVFLDSRTGERRYVAEA
ncbi:MAG: hypothetical protein QOF49_179 [Chloroflexota bacterium]|jgi:hypothetical protein|nr:hypothetical protein [Chloroflexota bacterium]